MMNRSSFLRYGGVLPLVAALNACSVLSQNPAPVFAGTGAAYPTAAYAPQSYAPAPSAPAAPHMAGAPLKSALMPPAAAQPSAPQAYVSAGAAYAPPAAPAAPAAAVYVPPPAVPVAPPAAYAQPYAPAPYAPPAAPTAGAAYVPPVPAVPVTPPVSYGQPYAPAEYAPSAAPPSAAYAQPYMPAAAPSAPPVAPPPSDYGHNTRSSYTPSYAAVNPRASRHTVVAGDTIYNIALRYGISQADLRAWNGLSGDHIQKGQVLHVKAPTGARRAAAGGSARYTVVAGDNLLSIARRHNMTVAELMALNGLTDANHVRIGQVLRVRQAAVRPVSDAAERRPLAAASAPAPAPDNAAAVSGGGGIALLRPVPGRIVMPFQQTNSYILMEAVPGQKVMAAADGRVLYRGQGLDGHAYGEVLIIGHADRYVTAYSNIRDIQLTDGQTVRRGQILGTVDNHAQHGSRFYFRLAHNGQAHDPEKYLTL